MTACSGIEKVLALYFKLQDETKGKSPQLYLLLTLPSATQREQEESVGDGSASKGQAPQSIFILYFS